MSVESIDSFKAKKKLEVGGKIFSYFSLDALENQGLGELRTFPHVLKLLLENLLRFEDGGQVNKADIKTLARGGGGTRKTEISFHPARVWLQNVSDITAIANLAECRRIMPLHPQVSIDWLAVLPKLQNEADKPAYAECDALLAWAEKAIEHFKINRNLSPEFLVFKEREGMIDLFPTSLIGTGNGVAAANALGILGLNVSSIEAESVIFNQPVFLSMPNVLGFKLQGHVQKEISPVKILQCLEEKGVSGAWIEFYGQGLDQLSYQDRVLISEGAIALGAVCTFFPVDQETLRQIMETTQDSDQVQLIQAYCMAQGLWRDHVAPDPIFKETLSLDFSQLAPQSLKLDSFQKKQAENLALDIPIQDFMAPLTLKRPVEEMQSFCLSQAKILFSEQIALISKTQVVSEIEPPFILVVGKEDRDAFHRNRAARSAFSSGIKAVVAEHFDSEYRADLIRLGILPLLFKFGMSRNSLQMEGGERLDFVQLSLQMKPGMDILCRMSRATGSVEEFVLKCGIETRRELDYFRCGGVLGYVLMKTHVTI